MPGLRGSEIKFSLIIGVLLIRYMALPLLGIAIVKGAIHLGIVHSDPLYQFTLLMQYAVPPAMNISNSLLAQFMTSVTKLHLLLLLLFLNFYINLLQHLWFKCLMLAWANWLWYFFGHMQWLQWHSLYGPHYFFGLYHDTLFFFLSIIILVCAWIEGKEKKLLINFHFILSYFNPNTHFITVMKRWLLALVLKLSKLEKSDYSTKMVFVQL